MADSKITALTALTAADPINDMFPVVDVSDTSMAASGTTKRISANNILSSSPTASGALTVTGLVTAGSATITGDLTVDTNVLKVDTTNNRVGIGTATPATALQVVGEIRSSADISNSSDTIIYSFAGGTAGSVRAGLQLIGSTPEIRVYLSSATALTINSTSNLVLKGGTAAADGVGVTFPATQVASSDANCLDDYEEGTWTPVVADASTGGNVGTCVINSATYTKIGRQVSIQCDLRSITTTGMTGGNNLFIRGLPFASVKGGNGSFYTYRVGRNASTVSSAVTVEHGVSHAFLSLFTTSSANTNLSILVSDITSGTSELALSVTYTV